MYKPVNINGVDYSLGEFGRMVYSNRRRLNLTQVELAKKVYDLMNSYSDERNGKEFIPESGRVMISRIETGKIHASPEYAEALVYIFDTEAKIEDNPVLSSERVDEIISELKIIINSIPPRSAENLLTIARMIKNGELNSIK